jgi:hypothetical protein
MHLRHPLSATGSASDRLIIAHVVKSKHKAYFCALAQTWGHPPGCWELARLIFGVMVHILASVKVAMTGLQRLGRDGDGSR